MKNLHAGTVAALMLAAILPAHAAQPGLLPAPPVMLRVESTMASIKTLTVHIYANESGAKVDKAVLTLASPNKLRIVAVTDKERETLVSDGSKLKQWNNKNYAVGASAPTLADLNEIIDFDSLAGEMAEDVFTTPKDFASIPEFTDLGQRTVDGTTVDTLSATNFHGTKILTVDSATGLPLEYDYLRKRDGFTIKFSDYVIDKKLPEATFTASVPKGLKVYVQPVEPPLLANGTTAPDFTLPTPDGHSVTLSSLKGQIVLIDFWASWCPPCKMSMPHIQAVYNDLKSQGLVVLSVNTWDQATFAKDFLAKHPWYNTTFLIDPSIKKSVATTKYKVFGIPTLYIVGKDGKIADSYVDYTPEEESTVRADLAKLGLSKD